MKFVIETEIIKKYLKKISSLSSLLSSNNQIPELSGLYIGAFEKKIIFEFRNEYLDLRFEIQTQETSAVMEVGEIFIKARMLNDVISKMKGDSIKFTKVEDNLVAIKNIDSEYELNLMDQTKYSKASFSIEKESSIKLNSLDFKHLVEKVVISTIEKQPRKMLQGINLRFDGSDLIATATDGVRVSINKIPLNAQNNFSKTIHIKTLKEVLKLVEDEELRISFSDSKAIFETEELQVKLNLIEGQYPPTENAFPKKFLNILSIGKQEFIDLIEKIVILSSQKNPDNVVVKMSIKKNEIKIEARELEIGYAFASTKEFMWSGIEIFNISFNPMFVKESLKQMDEEVIIVQFNEQEQPFQINNVKNGALRCLILPLKVS